MQPITDPVQWKNRATQILGHEPKILFVGNIANNAYQSAKMLREVGIECDVFCNDYYHCMGCPEWDDSSFSGDIGNEFFPAWNKVDLKGFKRPRWFVQAPFSLCASYLTAKNSGDTEHAEKIWRLMEFYRNNQTKKWFQLLLKIYRILFIKVGRRLKKVFIRAGRFFVLLKKDPKAVIDKFRRMWGDKPKPIDVSQKYQQELDGCYPEHTRVLGSVAVSYINSKAIWLPIFQQYDVVVGCATSCIFPYVAGYKNYVAYEHGTIRNIPYEDNDIGSLTLLAYGNAKAIYSTNIDCYSSAQYISKPHHPQIVCGLHGFDVERIIQEMDLDQLEDPLPDLAPDITRFFSPCRIDYAVKGNDLLLHALERLVENNEKFVIVLVQWGKDLDRIKAEIDSNERVKACVRWVPPLNRKNFYHVLTQMDAVIDNLTLPAYGAIAIETLCANAPVLIQKEFLPGMVEQYAGAQIPYFPVNGEDELYEALLEVVHKTPLYLANRAQGRKWALKYHGHDAIRSKLLEAIGTVF